MQYPINVIVHTNALVKQREKRLFNDALNTFFKYTVIWRQTYG